MDFMTHPKMPTPAEVRKNAVRRGKRAYEVAKKKTAQGSVHTTYNPYDQVTATDEHLSFKRGYMNAYALDPDKQHLITAAA